MIKKLFPIVLSAASFARAETTWRLANATIEVTLSANGALTVLDRASGTTWDSIAPNPAASVSQVAVKEKKSLAAGINIDSVPLHLDLSLDGAEPAFNLALSDPGETPLTLGISLRPQEPIFIGRDSQL
jgi:hypothetical protein